MEGFVNDLRYLCVFVTFSKHFYCICSTSSKVESHNTSTSLRVFAVAVVVVLVDLETGFLRLLFSS